MAYVSASDTQMTAVGFCKNMYAYDIYISVPMFQGVTYDTGGADIKAGGVMAGMHR